MKYPRDDINYYDMYSNNMYYNPPLGAGYPYYNYDLNHYNMFSNNRYYNLPVGTRYPFYNNNYNWNLNMDTRVPRESQKGHLGGQGPHARTLKNFKM